MKKDFGKIILRLMAEKGIKTAKELAEKINEEAKEKIVTPSSVGRWICGETVPKSTSLMFLAKALKVSADLLLFDEGGNPDQTKSLERMVSSIVKVELQKSSKEDKNGVNSWLSKFLKSNNIPQEDKESILRQIKNLLKLYPNGENNN